MMPVSAWTVMSNDGLFTWHKGFQQSEVLTAKEWKQLASEITARVLLFTARVRGCRAWRITLVTTFALLVSTLSLGVSAQKNPAADKTLNEDQRILHVLNRLGFV